MLWSVLQLAIAFLAIIYTSFLFWRKLKEDYKDEEIFSLSLLVLGVGGFLGRLVFILASGGILVSFFDFKNHPGFSLPVAYLTGFLLVRIWSKRRQWDFWSLADNFAAPFLVLVLVFAAFQFIKELFANTVSVKPLGLFIISLVVILLNQWIGKKYRSFLWYRSGKIGFIGCFSSLAFFSLFLILEIFTATTLYLDTVASLAILLLSSVCLYHRAGRNFKEDIKNFKIKK